MSVHPQVWENGKTALQVQKSFFITFCNGSKVTQLEKRNNDAYTLYIGSINITISFFITTGI